VDSLGGALGRVYVYSAVPGVPSLSVSLLAAASQGLTLVHFSAQPESCLVTDAKASVHFSSQLETVSLM